MTWSVRQDARELVTVALFHSMFGLRSVELTAAERLRAAGHRVVVPDLFSGAVAGHGGAPAIEDGLALMEDVGWDAIVGRAFAAVRDLPATTVLCGLSMGAGVVGALWPERLDAAAAILVHAPTTVPRGIRPGTPVQVHVAVDDPFAPADQMVAFQDSAARAGAEAASFTYPGAGHFFTDAESPDHDRSAADVAWRRVGALLQTIR
jgi:dienelactone hydrolase